VRFPNVILYGFRSAFNGTYYIASPSGGSVPMYTVDGIGRPFYVMVFAPSPGTPAVPTLRRPSRADRRKDVAPERRSSRRLRQSPWFDSTRTDPDPDKNEWIGFDTPSEWPCADGRKSQIISLHSTPTAP
jgi:hypothetical protein